ncbi:MAG: hypothetical protein WCP08_03855 [Prolixibacteraceae bacterium]
MRKGNSYFTTRSVANSNTKSGTTFRLVRYCMILSFCAGFSFAGAQTRTTVQIKGEQFYINHEITLKGQTLNGVSLEGLLPNSRMVQGIFDDLNPETRQLWKYPDTGVWDPNRNTDEFVAAIPDWRKHGLLAFTLNIQGGSPTGYGNKGWINPGFQKDGQPIREYFDRLERILNKADQERMVVILGLFYFGQDEHLQDETAVKNAVTKTVDWLLQKGYRNVILEINNECNSKSYDHAILQPDRIHELIELAKNRKDPKSGYSYYVSTSYGGRHIPHPNVVKSADFLLLHGNGAENPALITQMAAETRKVTGYHPMPILFNEDDHYDFEKPVNNMVAALTAGVSWGYFDFRKRGETLAAGDSTFKEGYQSIPVDWGINSVRKMQFFTFLASMSQKNRNSEAFVKGKAKPAEMEKLSDSISIDNDYVRVLHNHAACTAAGTPGFETRIIVALNDTKIVSVRGILQLKRGKIAAFKANESYQSPSGSYFEVAFRSNHPPLSKPERWLEPVKNTIIYEDEQIRIFEERLAPGDTRELHSHAQRVVVRLNLVQLTDPRFKPNGTPGGGIQVPNTAKFAEPMVHVVKNLSTDTPLFNIVIEYKLNQL